MKKITIAIILMFCSTIYSQNKINVFTGINYSYFTDGVAGQILAEESFGLHIGASYEIGLNNKIAFRPAIAFDQVGDRTQTKYNYYGTQIDQLDLKLSYLNVPLNFKFWNKIYLIAGPQIGFLVDKQSNNGSAQIVDSNIDFGFNLGTGFTINQLFFEFGIYQGLTSIGNYVYFPTGSTKDIHNGYGQFTIGYRIK
ncbi:porin family protein [Flavobacterium sp.]|uniref:porin family protein n=1 Tax=Flavobacterium sp. TaxID=239 RepID=UPI002B5B76B8|nr:porin family protein [Flavobacterium sp.]HSD05598.1 porin family protein [Flavobacterium sp.]